jgi:hypothetical protein
MRLTPTLIFLATRTVGHHRLIKDHPEIVDSYRKSLALTAQIELWHEK